MNLVLPLQAPESNNVAWPLTGLSSKDRRFWENWDG